MYIFDFLKFFLYSIYIWIVCLFVGCLTSQPQATDLLRQFYMLPHWDRSCWLNVLPHPATVYWHQAHQSQCWPYNARHLAGQPLECQFLSRWYDSTPKKFWLKQVSNPGPSTLEADALLLGQRGGIWSTVREVQKRTRKISGLQMPWCHHRSCAAHHWQYHRDGSKNFSRIVTCLLKNVCSSLSLWGTNFDLHDQSCS